MIHSIHLPNALHPLDWSIANKKSIFSKIHKLYEHRIAYFNIIYKIFCKMFNTYNNMYNNI